MAMRTTSEPRMNSFRADAYSISPSAGPPWSSTITSWIMVSSRWVLGSSTGMRQLSVNKMMNRLKPTKTRDAPPWRQAAPSPGPIMVDSESEPERRGREEGAEKGGGLGRAGEVPSAAAPHPLEGGAGIQGRGHGEEASQPE